MTEKDLPDDDVEEFEVVELELEDGDREEFVIIDRVVVEDNEYALMAALEDVENMEEMTEEEYRDTYGEEGFLFLMRQDGDAFLELTEEENQKVREAMDQLMDESESESD